jgi:hypothetical protein
MVFVSALTVSIGMLSGPAAFVLFGVVMVFLIFAIDGLSQLMASSVSAGGASEVGWFNNSQKFCPSLQLFLGYFQLVDVYV